MLVLWAALFSMFLVLGLKPSWATDACASFTICPADNAHYISRYPRQALPWAFNYIPEGAHVIFTHDEARCRLIGSPYQSAGEPTGVVEGIADPIRLD